MRGNAVRFLLVSATIPNLDDLGAWISAEDTTLGPAAIMSVRNLSRAIVKNTFFTPYDSLARSTDRVRLNDTSTLSPGNSSTIGNGVTS